MRISAITQYFPTLTAVRACAAKPLRFIQPWTAPIARHPYYAAAAITGATLTAAMVGLYLTFRPTDLPEHKERPLSFNPLEPEVIDRIHRVIREATPFEPVEGSIGVVWDDKPSGEEEGYNPLSFKKLFNWKGVYCFVPNNLSRSLVVSVGSGKTPVTVTHIVVGDIKIANASTEEAVTVMKRFWDSSTEYAYAFSLKIPPLSAESLHQAKCHIESATKLQASGHPLVIGKTKPSAYLPQGCESKAFEELLAADATYYLIPPGSHEQEGRILTIKQGAATISNPIDDKPSLTGADAQGVVDHLQKLGQKQLGSTTP